MSDNDLMKTEKARDINRNVLLMQAKCCVLVPFPYKKTSNNYYEKCVKIGHDSYIKVVYCSLNNVGLPYGKDRTILAWLTTLSKRHSSEIVILDKMKDYMNAFKLQDQSYQYSRLKEGLLRIANLVVSVSYYDGDTSLVDMNNIVVIDRCVLPGKLGNKMIYGSSDQELDLITESKCFVRFSSQYYKHMKENLCVFPFELMVLYADEPRKWDMVQFLILRCGMAKSVSLIPWGILISQMGSIDKNGSRLIGFIRLLVDEIRMYLPDFPVVITEKGLVVDKWFWREKQDQVYWRGEITS